MKLLSLLFITLISIKSCGDTTTAETSSLNLTGEFHITALEANTEVPEKLSISFDTEKNTVSGFSGCNRFSGTYSVENETIAFGPLATTRKMCRGEANAIESRTLSLLSKINAFSIEGKTLSLKAGTETLIKAVQ